MSQMRDATRNLAIATKTRKSFATNFVKSLILCILESARCLMGIMSEPTKFERIHQIATIYVEFFFCSNVCVALVRQFVQLANHFFSATRFDHSLSEPCITNEPIVNAQELSFLTLLLELIRSVIFLIPSFLSVSVTVWSALPDVEVRNRKEVKN